MKFERYWERNGTRRPFPPLYEAVKAYGDRIYYRAPEYVNEGHCKWCGGQIINKHRKSFCCDKCRYEFEKVTVWNRGRDPYSLRILYRDNFTCQDCEEFHAFKNEHGIFVPIDDGELNVHHVLPVSEGGGDEPENLITLCIECHKKRHRLMIESEVITMGVTIYANGVERSFDCGYIGFGHLRQNIAKVFDKELYNVYSDIKLCTLYPDAYDKALNVILSDGRFTDDDDDILDFLFQSDCGGKISYKVCKKIYDLIKDVDFGEKIFTYSAYSDGKDYEYFKDFLRECYSKRAYMRWE